MTRRPPDDWDRLIGETARTGDAALAVPARRPWPARLLSRLSRWLRRA